MSSPSLANAIAHWCCTLDGVQESAKEFYDAVEESIRNRRIPDVETSRVEWRQGGIFSDTRLYLRIHRKDYVYDICGAPFGDSFFVSTWLCQPPSFWIETLLGIPVVATLTRIFLALVKPQTYYQIDTAMMFLGATHAAVLESVDQVTSIAGARPLSEFERQPVLRELSPGKAK